MLHANLNENKILTSAYETSLTIMCLNCHSIIRIFNIPIIYPKLCMIDKDNGLHIADINPIIDIHKCPSCCIDIEDADPNTLFEVDDEIAYEIFKLNMKGYNTLYSCAGHVILRREEFGSEFFYCMMKVKRCNDRDILRNICKTIINSFDVYSSAIPKGDAFHQDIYKESFEALIYTSDSFAYHLKQTDLRITENTIEECCDFIESNDNVIIRLGINSDAMRYLMIACDEYEVPSLQWYNCIINMAARNALYFIAENLPVVKEYLTEEYMVPDCLPNEVNLDWNDDFL